jgi:hypothetical protein
MVDRVTAAGFERARDVQGDVYYVFPGHLLHLYADGSWHSEEANPDSTLEQYLDHVNSIQVAYSAALL